MDKGSSSEVKSGVVSGVKKQLPFRPKVFLFRMLAAIFVTQAGFLAASFYICSRPVKGTTIQDRCPSIGQKAESLLLAATATTLSLLSGAGDPKP